MTDTQTVTKKASKDALLRELEAMSEVMVREKGLLNVQQTAILLDVSRERVYELMELGKLHRYEFTGRVYLSFAEVQGRREADVKSGRPPREGFAKVKKAVEIVANYDLPNLATKKRKKKGGKK